MWVLNRVTAVGGPRRAVEIGYVPPVRGATRHLQSRDAVAAPARSPSGCPPPSRGVAPPRRLARVACALLALAGVAPVHAQESLPTVSVAAVASSVVESEDAQFTVTRTGVTTGALTVRYEVLETGTMVRSSDEGGEDRPLLGRRGQRDGGGADGVRPHPRAQQPGDGGADGGCGVRAGGPTPRRGVLVRDDDDSPATGTVTVTGTAAAGETLTADTSDIADGGRRTGRCGPCLPVGADTGRRQ